MSGFNLPFADVSPWLKACLTFEEVESPFIEPPPGGNGKKRGSPPKKAVGEVSAKVGISKVDLLGPDTEPSADYSAYAQAALADELAKLARTPENDRNNQLNRSAFALGQLVGAGILDRGNVEAALHGLAVSIGLTESETRGTIRSGIETGIKEPRQLPERKGPGAQGQGSGAAPEPDEDDITLAMRGVAKGERKKAADKLATYYLAKSEPEARVLEILRGWNLKNTPPLLDKEIQSTVARVGKKEAVKRIRAGAGQDEGEPPGTTALPWEEQRQAALQGLGDLLGLPITDIKVSAGHESLWEIDLAGVSIMLTASEMCNQSRFHDRIFAAAVLSPNPIARAKNGQGGWRAVLKTFAIWATRIDAGPEATLRGEIQGLINNYLAEYRGIEFFPESKPISAHAAFFIIKRKGEVELFARLDPIYQQSKFLGYNIVRRKLAAILPSLGHVCARVQRIGCDFRAWRLDLNGLPLELRTKVYKTALDKDDLGEANREDREAPGGKK